MSGEKPLTLTDPHVVRCPHQAYKQLRENAPVYYDPIGKFYLITRYEDIRAAVHNSESFSGDNSTETLRAAVVSERIGRINKLFADKGWPRERTLATYEGVQHDERRQIFQQFLKPGKVKERDEQIRDTAYAVVDQFVRDGNCEVVSQLADPFSLRVIFDLIGAPYDAIPVVREASETIANNMGFGQTEAEEIEGVHKEIAAQHFFKSMIDELRQCPNDTILSQFINTELQHSDKMTDAQMMSHVMVDLFVAGSETTSRALTSAVGLMCLNPDVYRRLEQNQDGYLRTFAEEVLRLEGPAQGLMRVAEKDVELHGVKIPKGASVIFRVGAANRDPARFPNPDTLELERKNAATHLTFGSGTHACVGAPLARRELYWGIKALLDRVTDIKLADGEKVSYEPNMLFRGMKQLRITFTPR